MSLKWLLALCALCLAWPAGATPDSLQGQKVGANDCQLPVGRMQPGNVSGQLDLTRFNAVEARTLADQGNTKGFAVADAERTRDLGGRLNGSRDAKGNPLPPGVVILEVSSTLCPTCRESRKLMAQTAVACSNATVVETLNPEICSNRIESAPPGASCSKRLDNPNSESEKREAQGVRDRLHKFLSGAPEVEICKGERLPDGTQACGNYFSILEKNDDDFSSGPIIRRLGQIPRQKDKSGKEIDAPASEDYPYQIVLVGGKVAFIGELDKQSKEERSRGAGFIKDSVSCIAQRFAAQQPAGSPAAQLRDFSCK